MQDYVFFLDKLSELGRVEITCYSHGQYWDIRTNVLKHDMAIRYLLY